MLALGTYLQTVTCDGAGVEAKTPPFCPPKKQKESSRASEKGDQEEEECAEKMSH